MLIATTLLQLLLLQLAIATNGTDIGITANDVNYRKPALMTHSAGLLRNKTPMVAGAGQIAWRVHFAGEASLFAPVIGPDGTIYTNNNDTITAIASDGTVRWSTPASTRNGPVDVGPNGTVYAVNANDEILAIDPSDGSIMWTFFPASTSIVGGPNVGPDGNMYAVSDTDFGGIGLFSLTPTGTLRWSDEGSPSMSDDEGNGHSIIFSGDRAAVGMVPGTGNPPMTIWGYDLNGHQQYLLGEGCAGQLDVGPSGQFVTGIGFCQKVQTYNPMNGELLMSQSAPSQSPCSGLANVAVGPDGSTYTAFCYRAFWALHPDGSQKWFIDDFSYFFWMDNLGVAPDNSVVLDLGRNPGVHGWVRAFDTTDGTLRWQIDLPNEVGQSVHAETEPVFDASSTRAYFNAARGVNGDSYLYAIDLVDTTTMQGDLNADGVVNVMDLLALLDLWGTCPGCSADIDGDGVVDVVDLLIVIANWS